MNNNFDESFRQIVNQSRNPAVRPRNNNDNKNASIPNEHNFTTPQQQAFDTPEMIGSMQKILAENIGEYVVIEFLIGTNIITRKQGILYFVGTSFVTLYDDANNNYIVCDIFSIKFVYFYLPGQRPNQNFNILPNSNGNMG